MIKASWYSCGLWRGVKETAFEKERWRRWVDPRLEAPVWDWPRLLQSTDRLAPHAQYYDSLRDGEECRSLSPPPWRGEPPAGPNTPCLLTTYANHHHTRLLAWKGLERDLTPIDDNRWQQRVTIKKWEMDEAALCANSTSLTRWPVMWPLAEHIEGHLVGRGYITVHTQCELRLRQKLKWIMLQED